MVFFSLLKNLGIDFFRIWSIKKVYIICCILHKSFTLEKSGSWVIDQNNIGQPYCWIFKLTVSQEQNDEKAWYFACWYKSMKIKSWLKNIAVGLVKNERDHSGLRTLKVAVSQEVINRKNWFSLLIKIQESQKFL